MGAESLNIQTLAETRSPRVGTRLTYMPRDLLANCSFDIIEEPSDD